MLTYELKKAPGIPLYEALYRCIREDIRQGRLAAGDRLPSKRALAENLEVSKITVEGAYAALLSEGYIRSVEKVGYFVEDGWEQGTKADPKPTKNDIFPNTDKKPTTNHIIDLTANGSPRFPFSTWSRLQRQVMLDMGEELLKSLPNQGVPALREAIARHLRQFRGMEVSARNIIIGAGTDFLYNLLIQLLGREKCYAVEEPGYNKIRMIYAAGGVRCIGVPMDGQGVLPEALADAQVLHISPSHHYPTGIITSPGRRKALLSWVNQGPQRWIIEDDYDTEFRFRAHPMAAMQTQDPERVIYMNTFSKTLAASIRISYMVLPPALMERFQKTLGFYSCTVASFEQYTLARFLEQGYFEKHINRMRKFYKSRRNRVLSAIADSGIREKVTILEQNAGLHFLLRVDTRLSDEQLTWQFSQVGIRVRSLGSYYHESAPARDTKTLVINYSGLLDGDLCRLEAALGQLALIQ